MASIVDSDYTRKLLADYLPALFKRANKKYDLQYADDIVQDACVLILSVDTYSPRRGETPLARMEFALRRAAFAFRQGEIKNNHIEMNSYNEPSSLGNQEAHADLSIVMSEIGRLPEMQRLSVLDYSVGYTYKEIGSRHGMSKQGAHKHVKLARKALAALAA